MFLDEKPVDTLIFKIVIIGKRGFPNITALNSMKII